MNRLAILLLLPLAGCGLAQPDPPPAPDPRIACALDGADAFERVCSWEQESERITLRRPDGGFRRILASEDGIEAADGAETVSVVRLAPNLIEIVIAEDRYRLPVEIR